MKPLQKLIMLNLLFLFGAAFYSFGQINAPGASASFPTDYSSAYTGNGGENDMVYVFCGNQNENAIGELEVGTSSCEVNWFRFDGVSYQPMGVVGSVASNLTSGGYMAQVNCGGDIDCYRAWVWVNQAFVDVADIEPSCLQFNLGGSVDALDDEFVIQDPPGVNFIVDQNTEITVCFWADHTWVSDLGFYLKTPGHAMDEPAFPAVDDGNHEVVELLPAASDWGPGAEMGSWTGIPWATLGCSNPDDENSTCQGGNGVENFCFSSELEAGNPTFTPCVCDLVPPLTGLFASVGPWSPIYGALAGDEGWNVQIYDCESSDYGSLNRVVISFTGETQCGETTFVYDSNDISESEESEINDNSCSAATASSYTVPAQVPPGEYTVTSSITSQIWSCSGSSFSSNALDPVVVPGTSDYPTETADFTLTITETIDVPSAPTCEHSDVETFITNPSDATITPIAPLCVNSSPLMIEVADQGGEFSISPNPGNGALVEGVFYPEFANPGTYNLSYEISGACPDSDQIEIIVYESITVENFSDNVCNSTNTAYTISFDVVDQEGSGTQFQVNDGTGYQTYNNGYSEQFPSPSNYSLTVTDMHGCNNYVFDGSWNCSCTTFAGSMTSLEPVTLCQGSCLAGEVMHNGNQILDGNDEFEYILHDGSAFPADESSIYARGNNLNFCFSAGMVYGQVYYVSAICGDDDGENHVDYSGDCYSQSQGTPVVWLQNPVAHISDFELTVCGLDAELVADAIPDGMIGTWTVDAGSFVALGGGSVNDNEIIASVGSGYGDYTFTWSVQNGACTGSDDILVHFYPSPNAYAGNDTIVCGTEVELNALLSQSGSDGLWSANGVSFNPATSENTFATLMSGDFGSYVLTWTESLGSCVDQDYLTVTFIENPQPNVVNNVDTICGVSGHLFVENSNFEGVWRAFEDGIEIFPLFTPQNSPSTYVQISNYSGNYRTVDFVWTETNTSETVVCENSVNLTRVFARVPSAFGGATPDDVCGNVYQLNADTTGSSWANMYWQVKDGIIAEFDDASLPDAVITIDPLSSFGDSAHVTVPIQWVTSSGGRCADIDTVYITFYEAPNANAGLDAATCGLQYNLEAFYSILPSMHYTPEGYWENVDGNPGSVNFENIDSNNTIVNVGTEGEYTFVRREINEHYPSCESTDTVVITFKEIPEIFAGEDFDVCGQDACLSAVSAGYTFTWQQTPGASFDDQTLPGACVHYGGFGPVDFYILESNDECVSADTVTVTFWRTPTAVEAVAAHDTLACGLEFTRLRANNPGEGVTGYWISVPSNGVTFYNQSYDDTVSVLNFGDYDFYWVESTGPDNAEPDFCTDTSEVVPVVFVEVPVANAGLDTIFCGQEGQMNAEFSVAGSTGSWIDLTSNVDFEDYTNPETPVSSNIYTSDDNSYFDLVWTENNMTCTDADTVRVEFARIPIATVTVIPPRCEGEAASILANDDDLVGYSWNWNGGIVDSTWEANAHGGFYRHLVRWNNDDTVHSFELTTENEWGCISLGTIGNVYEPYRPEYIVASYPDTCALGLGGFRLDPDTTTVTDAPGFSWINLDGETEALVIGDTTFNVPAGTYTAYHSYNTFNNSYTAQYIDLFGTQQCRDTFDLLVDTAGLVYAEIAISSATDMNALVAPNAEVWFDNLSDGDNVRTSCTWYFGDGESTNSCDDQISHVYTEPNECYEPYFVIRVKNLPECRDTAFLECIEIDDMSLLEIPNVFTPNGDGMNDFFQVKAQTLQSFQGIIVNRWGVTIYEWTDYETKEAGWDGRTSGGSEAAPGVYYFIVKAVGMDGIEYEETGPFHLVRGKE